MFANNDETAPIPEPKIQPNETIPEPVSDSNASMPRAARNKWADLPRREQSTRVHNLPSRYLEGSTEQEINAAIHEKNQHHAFIAYNEDPHTYAKAMASPYSKEWEKALRDEVKQLEDTGTIMWMNRKDVPEDKSLVGARIVWKTKHDGDGAIAKHKARIVAQGFSQIPGQDYNETYASTAHFTTFRSLLSLAAHEDWEIHQFDVNGAYLKGELEEEIYMEIPFGVDLDGREGMVWKLLKHFYWLKQSVSQYKKKRDKTIDKFGFTRSNADDSIYCLVEDGKTSLLVLAYVDDTIPAGPRLDRIIKFKKDFNARLEITDQGEIHYILGIRVTRNRQARTITLDQTAYFNTILNRFGMQDCNPVHTPLNTKDRLSSSQSPTTESEHYELAGMFKGLNYLEGVGSLLYACQTRPDLAHATGVLAQFGANPGRSHYEALNRVLRYLKATLKFGLTLGGSKNEVDLVGWSDADWAQDTDTRRSVGAFVFDVAGGYVSWSLKKQPTVALSTAEAKYMAASNATKEAIWLRTLLSDMGFPPTQATTIHADNQACIALAHNPVNHSRAKHIDIRHHFIRERVANKEINLQHCSTKDMLADILTKQLPRDAFEKFRAALGVGEY